MDVVRRIEETALPGIGMRFSFELSHGQRAVVVVRNDGRRDVLRSSPHDEDAFDLLMSLDEGDARTMAELLGGSAVERELDRMRDEFEGLVLQEIRVTETSPANGRSLGEAAVRETTGATIVVVQRDDTLFVAPGPELVLMANDRVVAAGTSDDIERARTLLCDD